MNQNEVLQKENKKIKSHQDSQEAKLRDLTKVVASQSEKIHVLEQRSGEFAVKADFERHGREINKVKEEFAQIQRSSPGTIAISGTLYNHVTNLNNSKITRSVI